MTTRPQPRPFEAAGVYDEAGMAWALRGVGPHLHPGGETATVALADRAAEQGFPGGGKVLEVASALGAPARYLARRFGASVICVDLTPAMHAAADQTNRTEGLGLRVELILALAESLPFKAASLDAAWSQDALCHMEKDAVVAEVARVLRPGAVFAFSDWVAMAPLNEQDRERLGSIWGFPSLLRISEYVALLNASGFEVLGAEDRTRAVVGGRPLTPVDQELFEYQFARRFGEGALADQKARNELWGGMIAGGRGGYALFVARRRGG